MKRTDYAEVAPRYDDNEIRHRIPKDDFLTGLVSRTQRRPLAALDLACGTGNYLGVQSRAFGADVLWRGVDASEAMLARARDKVPDLELHLGRAESLPYDSGQFDYTTTSFAFHHFEDKPRALDEVRRVSRAGAGFRLVNIDPPRMRGWWVYAFFPEAWLEDQKRFWSTDLLHYELGQRGYEARVRVDYELANVKLAEVFAEAQRRDVSQLCILTEAQYQGGLARMATSLEKKPDAVVATEIALVVCTAILET